MSYQDSPTSSQDQTYPAGDYCESHGSECQTLQCKFRTLYVEFEKEKMARTEAEKAFYRMMEMYEKKKTEFDLFEAAFAKHKMAFDIAGQMKQKYCEVKQIAEEKIIKLNEANDIISILKKNLTQEKRKMEQMKNENKFLKEPVKGEHTACDLLFEQERTAKENALEQIEAMCEEMQEIKNESELFKKTNREMKEKVVEMINIKNELVQQNQTLLFQVDTMQDILGDKDKQIESLATRNVLDDPAVQHKMQDIAKAHENELDVWRSSVDDLHTKIETINTEKSDLKLMFEERISEVEATCKNEHVLKKDYDALEIKTTKELLEREQAFVRLIEAFKATKKEMAKLQKEIREKDSELAVREAKARYEELLKENADESESID